MMSQKAMQTRNTIVQILAVSSLLLAVTAVIAITGLDVGISRLWYVPGHGFPYGTLQPWRALYQYGIWPAILTAAGALVGLIVSFFRLSLRPYRMMFGFLVLLYLLGPGLVVNVALKDHWGRARPVQITEFGGNRPFTQPWQKTDFAGGRSFPSGHASVAFYMAAPYFLLRSTRKKWASLWLTLGITYGVVMGFARVVQGGHFVSDVLWAGGIVYLTGLILAAVMRLDNGYGR